MLSVTRGFPGLLESCFLRHRLRSRSRPRIRLKEQPQGCSQETGCSILPGGRAKTDAGRDTAAIEERVEQARPPAQVPEHCHSPRGVPFWCASHRSVKYFCSAIKIDELDRNKVAGIEKDGEIHIGVGGLDSPGSAAVRCNPFSLRRRTSSGLFRGNVITQHSIGMASRQVVPAF